MNLRNRIGPFAWGSLLVLLIAAAPAAAEQKRRNVLFLISDDLCADLGCYGAPVKSPNIDRLASRGVKFNRAYCQYPLCGPSRCSFMTGLRPDTTGVITNGPDVRAKLKDVVTLPQLFRNNGYFSARVGKIYHLGIPGGVGTSGPDDPQSWDYTFNPKGAEFTTDGDEVWPDRKDAQGFRYVIGKGDGHEQADFQSADEAVRLLREQKGKDKPFFLAVGFIRPHVPEIAPKSFFDLYPLESIKLPAVPANDLEDIPAAAFHSEKIDRGMTPQQCLESIRAYRATTSFMDAQLGRVVDELEKLGLAEETVITFIGDHGYCLGQHRSWQKMMLFEPVCRVPMIIAAPGVKPAETKAIVESIDLAPTVAALCGLTPPKETEGMSLIPILADPSASVKAAAFTQLHRAKRVYGRSVRTDRYRYTQWTKPDGSVEVELYDEAADPGEITNLANDPKHAGTVAALKMFLPAEPKEN